uniref:Putative secreted protein n=1 Tax=Anopheles triannulatus TaxID=58253 RepID=A0A2M4B736_9DIPT
MLVLLLLLCRAGSRSKGTEIPVGRRSVARRYGCAALLLLLRRWWCRSRRNRHISAAHPICVEIRKL